METQGLIKTKKCPKCGRELPVTEFYKRSDAPDGLQGWCKQCQREAVNSRKYESGGASEEMRMYTSRQLMEELARRGYTGELKFVKIININKL